MSNYYLHSLFPTPLFETVIGDCKVVDEIKRVLEEIKNKKYDLRLNDGNNFISMDSFVLDEWGMNETKSAIINSLNLFAKNNLLYEYDEIYITQSWVNINPYLTSHPLHFHRNSFLSGVLYLNTGEDCGDIRFHREENLFEPEVNFDSENQFSWSYRYFNPIDCLLLIFPSHLKHSVSPNLNKDVDRISLSFNTFLTNFGSKDSRTFLTTNI